MVLTISEKERLFLESKPVALDDLKTAVQGLMNSDARSVAGDQCGYECPVRAYHQRSRHPQRSGCEEHSRHSWRKNDSGDCAIREPGAAGEGKAREGDRRGKVRSWPSDMLESMRAANGVGLAAQQVGTALQLAIVDVSNASEDRPSTMEINGQPVNLDEWMPLIFVNPAAGAEQTTGGRTGGMPKFSRHHGGHRPVGLREGDSATTRRSHRGIRGDRSARAGAAARGGSPEWHPLYRQDEFGDKSQPWKPPEAHATGGQRLKQVKFPDAWTGAFLPQYVL